MTQTPPLILSTYIQHYTVNAKGQSLHCNVIKPILLSLWLGTEAYMFHVLNQTCYSYIASFLSIQTSPSYYNIDFFKKDSSPLLSSPLLASILSCWTKRFGFGLVYSFKSEFRSNSDQGRVFEAQFITKSCCILF